MHLSRAKRGIWTGCKVQAGDHDGVRLVFEVNDGETVEVQMSRRQARNLAEALRKQADPPPGEEVAP